MTNRDQASIFQDKSAVKASDLDHRKKINFNIGKYNAVVPQGKQQYEKIHLARERAKNIKWRSLETLDQQLERFEQAFTKRGGKLIWAEDSAGALKEILAICKVKQCKAVVKSKSMVTEEIHLNKFLQENGIESLETDLGEYIQQLDNEPPYHIVTPAMHKSKEDIARLFILVLEIGLDLAIERLFLALKVGTGDAAGFGNRHAVIVLVKDLQRRGVHEVARKGKLCGAGPFVIL